MKKLIVTIITSVSFMFGLELPANHIVDTTWLEKNLNNKSLVIIDTRTKKEYEKSHIKGAINYPKKSWFQGKLSDVPKLPNTPKQIEQMLQNAGITEDSLIIFYAAGLKEKDFGDAASGIWNFMLYGIENVAMLNGGFAKWEFEKKSTTKELPKIAKSDIEIEKFNKNINATTNDIVEAIYDEDIQITDVRVSKFYRGEDDRKDLVRHGRIPSAKLTPMIRYVKKENNYFVLMNKDEARATLNNSGYGVELNKPLITYCNTGHKARGLWFVAKYVAGMEDVKVYDGGIVEYSKTNLEMEKGEAF